MGCKGVYIARTCYHDVSVIVRLSVLIKTIFSFLCIYVQTMLALVKLAEWPPFGKQLLPQFIICPLCILSIGCFCFFPFWLRGQDLVLVVPVPGPGLLLTWLNQ